MKNKKEIILSFIFVGALGVLLHFTYGWSHQNPIIGLFSSKNESAWEHLKLFFFPMLLLTLIQIIRNPSFIPKRLASRTIALLSGMTFIIVVFYTFWGISGYLIGVINISIYFLGVLFAFIIEEKTSKKDLPLDVSTCFLIWIVFAVLFFLFSVKAPTLGLFYDLQLHPKKTLSLGTFQGHL